MPCPARRRSASAPRRAEIAYSEEVQASLPLPASVVAKARDVAGAGDGQGAAELEEAAHRITGGRTAVVIAHRLAQAARADEAEAKGAALTTGEVRDIAPAGEGVRLTLADGFTDWIVLEKGADVGGDMVPAVVVPEPCFSTHSRSAPREIPRSAAMPFNVAPGVDSYKSTARCRNSSV